ncbi:MAG TPA: zinc-binding dehydrogenase [Pyrinomonadaceae bacterium]|nr:zinc-binding dehydrogenase [Pyrinomonadaceae bacterium]
MGADITLDYRETDVVSEVRRLTGAGADVAIEALGTQQTFESALRSLRPAGTLSSLGVYSGKLAIPYEAFAAGIGDHRIVTTLCRAAKSACAGSWKLCVMAASISRRCSRTRFHWTRSVTLTICLASAWRA